MGCGKAEEDREECRQWECKNSRGSRRGVTSTKMSPYVSRSFVVGHVLW